MVWPVQVGNPPLLAAAFQLRPELLGRLAADAGSAVVSQLVAGDGGVGKTQLAVAAFEQAAAGGVQLRVWVTASSRSAIVTGLAAAYEQVDAPGSVVQGETEQTATAFLAWLATTRRSWLIVYDDVTDPGDVRGLWPRGPAGQVIATTRRRDLQVPDAVPVPVGVFAARESAAYLAEKLTGAPAGPVRAGVLVGAAGLAGDLGHLPLALAQAAAMITFDGITCAEYRGLLADRSRELAELFPAGAAADEYAHTVASAWSLAVERANGLDPVGLAGPVLELAAVLDANGAPGGVWAAAPALAYLAERAEVDVEAVSGGSVRRALRNLHQLSLITHDPDPGAAAGVRMHALLQRAVTEILPGPVLDLAVRAAADALLAAWPDVENDPGLAGVLRQNASTLAARYSDPLWRADAHPVLLRIGRSLGEAGQVAAARDQFAALSEDCATRLGPDHSDTLAARDNLAQWRGEAGDAAGDAAAYEAVLADRVRVLGADHPDTLATRHNLARWRGEAGDAAGAAAAYEELLADRVRVLGADHPDTLATRHNLARWRGEAGDAAGAAAAYEELLADRLRVLGADHPETLAARHNLALWRGVAGDAAGAVLTVALVDDVVVGARR